jgi:uncharacterized damage-inducible protein DinB
MARAAEQLIQPDVSIAFFSWCFLASEVVAGARRGLIRALGVLREGILSKWRHLFVDGEYARREKVLSGLTLEQVKRPPSEQSHSIYEELWHATRWQTIIVTRDEELYASWQEDDLYPAHPPEQEEEWTALVREFLSGLEKALEWASSPEKLGVEVDTEVTMGDVLHSLAVHNAYHMGKIVAVRQLIGAWPPAGES